MQDLGITPKGREGDGTKGLRRSTIKEGSAAAQEINALQANSKNTTAVDTQMMKEALNEADQHLTIDRTALKPRRMSIGADYMPDNGKEKKEPGQVPIEVGPTIEVKTVPQSKPRRNSTTSTLLPSQQISIPVHLPINNNQSVVQEVSSSDPAAVYRSLVEAAREEAEDSKNKGALKKKRSFKEFVTGVKIASKYGNLSPNVSGNINLSNNFFFIDSCFDGKGFNSSGTIAVTIFSLSLFHCK